MATERKPAGTPSMHVIEAILNALGIPPGVIRANDAVLRLDLGSLPTLDLTVIVPPSKIDDTAAAIAEACKAAGTRVVVNIERMDVAGPGDALTQEEVAAILRDARERRSVGFSHVEIRGAGAPSAPALLEGS